MLFCRAKDLFYEIESRYSSENYDKVIYALELAIWYLQGKLCLGEHVVFLDKINHLRKYKETDEKLWKEVLTLLAHYYFFL